MYYYKKDESGRIEKYSIVFNKEALIALKIEIINNCSEISHKEVTGPLTVAPNHFDFLRIRNYKEVKEGRVHSRDFYSQNEVIYTFSYDLYEPPYLVELIDELLEGNIEAMEEIINPSFKKEKESFNDRIQKLEEEISNIPNLNYAEKVSKLEDLKNLVETAKLNSNQEDVRKYYKKVADEISLWLVDTIDIDHVEKVISFFDLSKDNIKTLNQNFLYLFE